MYLHVDIVGCIMAALSNPDRSRQGVASHLVKMGLVGDRKELKKKKNARVSGVSRECTVHVGRYGLVWSVRLCSVILRAVYIDFTHVNIPGQCTHANTMYTHTLVSCTHTGTIYTHWYCAHTGTMYM